MRNHYFTFNGRSSEEFGLKIEQFRQLDRPARKYEYANVPGRNGVVYDVQDAWEEDTRQYQVFGKADTTEIDLTGSRLNVLATSMREVDGLVVELDPLAGATNINTPYENIISDDISFVMTEEGFTANKPSGATLPNARAILRKKNQSGFPGTAIYSVKGISGYASADTWTATLALFTGTDYETPTTIISGIVNDFQFRISSDTIGVLLSINFNQSASFNDYFAPVQILKNKIGSFTYVAVFDYSKLRGRIQLPEAVYGGTLDMLNGKLTIDRKIVTVSDAWSYEAIGGTSKVLYYQPDDKAVTDTAALLATKGLLANDILYEGYYDPSNLQNSRLYQTTQYIMLYDGRYSTKEAYLEHYEGVSILYYLEEPIEMDVPAISFSIPAGNNLIRVTNGARFTLHSSPQSLADLWHSIMAWLTEPKEYAILTDTYDTAHYRLALFLDGMDVANIWNKFGRTIVSFRCRPEHFLLDYDDIEMSGGSLTINNPTQQIARPVITLTGNGSSSLIKTTGRENSVELDDNINPLEVNLNLSGLTFADMIYIGFPKTGHTMDFDAILTYDYYTEGQIRFTTSNINYGIGLPVRVRPSSQYNISWNGFATVVVKLYNDAGFYIRTAAVGDTPYSGVTFDTTPDTAWAVISYFGSQVNTEYTISNIMLVGGDAPKEYKAMTTLGDDDCYFAINDVAVRFSRPFDTVVIDCDDETIISDEGDFSQWARVTTLEDETVLSSKFLKLDPGENTAIKATSTYIPSAVIDGRIWEV